MVLAYPSHYQFTEKDLQGLQSPCNGTALFGIVTQNHPLFALPIVCENHSKRRYYHIYGRVRCPDVYTETKLPNLAQLCIQGSGGRPQLVEGKIQTNTENVKRARLKKQDKYTDPTFCSLVLNCCMKKTKTSTPLHSCRNSECLRMQRLRTTISSIILYY